MSDNATVSNVPLVEVTHELISKFKKGAVFEQQSRKLIRTSFDAILPTTEKLNFAVGSIAVCTMECKACGILVDPTGIPSHIRTSGHHEAKKKIGTCRKRKRAFCAIAKGNFLLVGVFAIE